MSSTTGNSPASRRRRRPLAPQGGLDRKRCWSWRRRPRRHHVDLDVTVVAVAQNTFQGNSAPDAAGAAWTMTGYTWPR